MPKSLHPPTVILSIFFFMIGLIQHTSPQLAQSRKILDLLPLLLLLNKLFDEKNINNAMNIIDWLSGALIGTTISYLSPDSSPLTQQLTRLFYLPDVGRICEAILADEFNILSF